MCDEYDDERMRAFWRAFAERQEVAKLNSNVDEADDNREFETPVLELGSAAEPKRNKPRTLPH